jgi:hypothetical protein
MRPVLTLGLSEGFVCTSRFSSDIEDFEIMQFTGLTDKNGVEIYEGDILEGVNYDVAKPKKFIGVVEYDWNRFVVKADGFPKYDINKTLKVVGNIYENPEEASE